MWEEFLLKFVGAHLLMDSTTLFQVFFSAVAWLGVIVWFAILAWKDKRKEKDHE